jgi:hypothetical protein
MSVVETVHIYCYDELLIREDYHIYCNDSFDNGLNSKYNHYLSEIIMNKSIDLSDKYSEIIEYCCEYADKRKIYNKKFNEIMKIFNDIKLYEISLSDDERDWYFDKNNKNISYYNPFAIDNNCYYFKGNLLKEKTNTYNNALNLNVFGIYLMYFKNSDDYHVFCSQNGIMNHFNKMKNKIIFDDNIINKIIKNGVSNTIIYPVEYIYTTDYRSAVRSNEITRKLRNIRKYMDNYVKLFTYNRYDILNYTHNTEHINYFISNNKNVYNSLLYCIISLILRSTNLASNANLIRTVTKSKSIRTVNKKIINYTDKDIELEIKKSENIYDVNDICVGKRRRRNKNTNSIKNKLIIEMSKYTDKDIEKYMKKINFSYDLDTYKEMIYKENITQNDINNESEDDNESEKTVKTKDLTIVANNTKLIETVNKTTINYTDEDIELEIKKSENIYDVNDISIGKRRRRNKKINSIKNDKKLTNKQGRKRRPVVLKIDTSNSSNVDIEEYLNGDDICISKNQNKKMSELISDSNSYHDEINKCIGNNIDVYVKKENKKRNKKIIYIET